MWDEKKECERIEGKGQKKLMREKKIYVFLG